MPISFSFRGHTDGIPLLRLFLLPDTDDIKKIFPGEKSEEHDIKVKFEGLEDFLGGPAPCEIYLGRVYEKRRSKTQVLHGILRATNSPPRMKTELTWRAPGGTLQQ